MHIIAVNSKYMLENETLYDLKPIHFQMLVNHLYEEGYKSTSVKPIISVIDQCLERQLLTVLYPIILVQELFYKRKKVSSR